MIRRLKRYFRYKKLVKNRIAVQEIRKQRKAYIAKMDKLYHKLREARLTGTVKEEAFLSAVEVFTLQTLDVIEGAKKRC